MKSRRHRSVGNGYGETGRQVGPYSRVIDRGALGRIDGRSREGRFLRRYERMLTDHVGGAPTVTQRALIHRAARLALHVELLDEKSLIGGHEFGLHDVNFYVAWTNSLARILAKLGLDPSEKPSDPTAALREHLARYEAAD